MTRIVLFLAVAAQPPGETVSLRLAVAPAETLHVEVSGRGRPILFVPGLIGGGFGFRKVVPLLNEAGFRTIAIDPLGTGKSSRPSDADYSLDAQADRFAAALDTLGIARAGIVAHAIGGSVALRLATRRPDLADHILLLEAGAAESATTSGFRRAMKLAPLLKLLGAGTLRGRIRGQLIAASGDATWVDARVLAGYTDDAAADVGATLDVFRAMARSKEREPLAPRLASVHAPTLLLLGGATHDSAPNEAELALLARELPAFALETLPGVGHFPHEEVPHQVRDAVLRLARPAVVLSGEARAPHE